MEMELSFVLEVELSPKMVVAVHKAVSAVKESDERFSLREKAELKKLSRKLQDEIDLFEQMTGEKI